MTEWIITSSVLILVVIALRTALKGKISLRLQYALWALVLVRLLIPGSLFGSSFSVMNAVGKPAAPAEITIADPPSRRDPIFEMAPSITQWVDEEGNTQNDLDWDQWEQDMDAAWEEYKEEHTRYITLPVADILRIVWYVGMAAMALWLIIGNLRFYLRLTRSREIVKFAPPALYVAEGIETPCLFGLFQPAIYVTPEVAENKTALAHVLAHEETHYRHKDHIWAVLRCACLVLHWYNPLVWLAAALSRRDSELACDEGAIRRLGEEQRSAYGRTLIGLTCTGVGGLLRTSTTMTGSKKSIKERIVLIAKKPKMKLYTLVAVILIAVIAAGCTFTGKKTEQQRVVSWMSSLEKEDLEQARLMFMDDGTVEMPLLGADGAESLHSILQQVREEDLLENNDLDSGDVHLAVPVGEDDVLLFDCLADRTIRIVCDNQEMQEKYGFYEPCRLDCPELYSFIIGHRSVTEMSAKGTIRWIDDLEGEVWDETFLAACGGEDLTENVFREVLMPILRQIEPEDLEGRPEPGAGNGLSDDQLAVFLIEKTGDINMARSGLFFTCLPEEGMLFVHGFIDESYDYSGALLLNCPELYDFIMKEANRVPDHTEEQPPAALFADPVSALETMVKSGGLTIALRSEMLGERTAYTLSDSQTERIRFILGGYGWTVVDEAPAMTGDVLYLSSKDGARLMLAGDCVRYQLGDADVRWKAAALSEEDYTVMEDVRWSVYDPLEFHWSNIPSFEADGPKAAAEQFAVLYGQLLQEQAPGSIYRARDYAVRQVRACEISTDQRAIMAEMTVYVLPDGEHSALMTAGAQDGTGEYEGWVMLYRQFVLERGVDGRWCCLSFGNAVERLRQFGYENGLWGAIYGNPKAYRCRETDPQKAAETLVFAYVDDLTKMDNMRCFTITDYRNLEVSVTPTLEMSEADRSVYNYNLKESEIGENHWIVEFDMEYRWTGILHAPPAGPGNGDYWMDQVHQGSPVGFLLTREGDEFILRSRYPDRY